MQLLQLSGQQWSTDCREISRVFLRTTLSGICCVCFQFSKLPSKLRTKQLVVYTNDFLTERSVGMRTCVTDGEPSGLMLWLPPDLARLRSRLCVGCWNTCT